MSRRSPAFFWLAIAGTLLSIGAHIYLTNHHYGFKYGGQLGESFCNINEVFNCNKTTSSTYSEVLGIPISIFGGLVNFLLLALLLCFRFPIVSPSTQKFLITPIKLLSLGIFAASLIMGSLSLFVLKTLCPMCSASYILSILTLIGCWGLASDKIQWNSALLIKFIPASAAGLLAFGYFIHHNSLRQYGGKEVQEITRLQFEEWKNGPQKDLKLVAPLTMNENPQAKMKIVEFADFLCGHCARAFPVLHSFAKSHPNVEFSFQAFPLDGSCNEAVGRSVGTPCYLARVSHCAGQQGRAWDFQEWMFKNQRELFAKESAEAKVDQKISELMLDHDSFKACLEDENTLQIIRDQAKLGSEAGVKGTPTVFVNGKKAAPSIPLLELIYRSTL